MGIFDSIRNLRKKNVSATSRFLDANGNPKTVISAGGGKGLTGIGGSKRDERTLKSYWNYYNGEGVIFSAVNTIAWNTVMVGYHLMSDSPEAKKLIQTKFDEMDIDGVLLDTVIYAIIFGDSYIEKVRSKGNKKALSNEYEEYIDPVVLRLKDIFSDGTKNRKYKELYTAYLNRIDQLKTLQKKPSGYVSALKIVDPLTMQINIDEYGREESYQQKIGGRVLKTKLTTDDIIHLRFFPNPSSPYGVSIIEPSKGSINRMVDVDQSLHQAIVRHGLPKFHVKVGTETEPIPPKAVFDKIKSDLEDISAKNEFITPAAISINTIDERGVPGVDAYANTFQRKTIVGLMCPEESLGLDSGPLHPETELLVEGKGFIPITDVREGDMIASINPNTHSIEFQENKKNWIYKVSDDIFNFTGQSFSIKCTKNHRMYFKPQRGEFKIDLAQNLPSNFELLVGGLKWGGNDIEYITVPEVDYFVGDRWNHTKVKYRTEGKKYIPIDLWLEFLGYFLSEGCTTIKKNGDYRVWIRQCKKENLDKIVSCIKQLPFNISVYGDKITINSKQLSTYLSNYGKSNEKYIPENIRNLPPERLVILYDALMFGDGCENNYFTSSKQLANDVQEILLKMGYGSSIYCRDRIGREVIINGKVTGKCNYLQYTVTKNVNELTPQVYIHDTKYHKSVLKKEFYEGHVHCVTVDNGLILTRFDGKCVVVGNSTQASATVREIMFERFIKSIQHKLSTKLRVELINQILIENGFDENTVYMKFNSVTDKDEEAKAKWIGNLFRGFPEGKKPLSINEIRTLFDFPSIEGGDDLVEGTIGGEKINTPPEATAD